jgi:hypothetical protein
VDGNASPLRKQSIRAGTKLGTSGIGPSLLDLGKEANARGDVRLDGLGFARVCGSG